MNRIRIEKLLLCAALLCPVHDASATRPEGLPDYVPYLVSDGIEPRPPAWSSRARMWQRVIEVLAYGLPPGLGSHVHWDRRLDAKLAQAIMSIQAIKGVEVGDGFLTTTRRGSAAHDELFATEDGIARSSDRAGARTGDAGNAKTGRDRF